jgi:hypothetical protein
MGKKIGEQAVGRRRGRNQRIFCSVAAQAELVALRGERSKMGC